MPTVPPRLRQNWIWLVATPISSRGSALWTAVKVTGKLSPRPAPTMTMSRTTSQRLLWTPTWASRTMPTSITAMPTVLMKR
ncbi:MAG: hypothetical protein M3075_11805 [Candidatus Dormibacteraeota bacterium]|nr:hypothetical protein [Candidatus Dormibacteraeota bacterium]